MIEERLASALSGLSGSDAFRTPDKFGVVRPSGPVCFINRTFGRPDSPNFPGRRRAGGGGGLQESPFSGGGAKIFGGDYVGVA